jgi:Rrf2 family protein
MDKGDNVINKRTVYAIRALYELAQSQEYSSTTDAIAQARNISKKFLPQILSDLSRAGLVRTTRGFGGGVRLSRPPEKISILEIIEVVQGNIFESEGGKNLKDGEPLDARLLELFGKAQDAMRAEFARMRLSDLKARTRSRRRRSK